jgi:hypothetical protein
MIHSDTDYDEMTHKRVLMKEKLVDLYVDVVRSKKLKKIDTKLLEITGFKNVLKILKSQKSFEKVASEWRTNEKMESINQIPTLGSTLFVS